MRPVSETSYVERPYTVTKPVYQTVNQERRYTVSKPVYQTERPSALWVPKAGSMKSMQAFMSGVTKVHLLVIRTEHRERRYTVRKPVYQTVNQGETVHGHERRCLPD